MRRNLKVMATRKIQPKTPAVEQVGDLEQSQDNLQKHQAKRQRVERRDSPRGPAVKNLLSNAGDGRSSPGRGTESPHAVGQLSQHAVTTELTRLN